ncbi:hypothetical protein [Streptomyces poriticola]|uniref:hypothetical protein n=1 Tax=Streptomyces poriticola TaxID=3120506 RepID=UPI002FCE3D62
MSEITEARLALGAARAAREVALRNLHEAEAAALVLREPDGSLPVVDASVPGNEELAARVQALRASLDAASAALARAEEAHAGAAAAYEALAGLAPLFPSDNLGPVLLLPVRIEAVYGAHGDGTPELRIRVYPDDVHVDSHEPALTDGEREAGTAYWRAVFASGDDAQRRRAAWAALVAATGGERATWIREALTPSAGPPGDPVFPEVETRRDAWNRAARTVLLPDRLEFSAYRDGTLVWRMTGADIPDTLPLGVAPRQADGDDGEEDTDDAPADRTDALPFDQNSRWLVDFEAAVDVGMGLSVPLESPTDRFDLLTVVGVGSQDAATGAQRVQDVLAARLFTDGLSPLPVGTPTNNTPESRSGWRTRGAPRDPELADAWQASYDPAGPQEAARLARAFGIDGHTVLARVCDPQGGDEALLAKLHRLRAQTAAWSGVWHPAVDSNKDHRPLADPWYATAADHFTSYVRGRGPLPLLRIGRQPYGVLPVSSLDLWRGADGDDPIAWHVGSFAAAFAEHVDRAVQVGEGTDQDAVLLDLLSREASPQEVARWAHLLDGTDQPPPPASAGSVPPALGLAWQQQFRFPADPAAIPQEAETITPFPDEIPPDLRAFLAARPLAQLLVLFHETVARMRQTRTAPVPEEFVGQYAPIASTLWQLRREPTVSLFYSHAEWVHNAISNTLRSGPVLPDAVNRAITDAEKFLDLFSAYVGLEDEAVEDLSRVERLFRETLEPLSHRVDAWATSLSTRRLEDLRTRLPTGIHTGAYGWLTDVEPTDPNPPREGYVVTPSLHHATTAAVLRSGWQAHSAKSSFAVDIQSARVRRAQAVIEGVRAGQAVPALLGYQIERALHDARLDRFIAGLRRAYPLAPLVQPDGPGVPQAQVSIGARNVVDGQALRRDRPELDDDAALAAAVGQELGDDAPALRRLLAELDETFDAVGDLLLAESVHQLVGGSALRAGLAADAAGRGQELPQDFDVLRTPRGGVAVTHHVGVLLPDSVPEGWADDRPLAALEPGLEAWVRERLGPADRWPVGPDLAGLGWCALDILVTPAQSLRSVLAARGEVDGPVLDRLMLLCERVRTALAGTVPLAAGHWDPGAVSPSSGYDLGDLDGRVRPWLGRVRAAAAALAAARPAGDTAPAVAELASLGLPVGADRPAAEAERLHTLLETADLAEPPPPPDAGTDPSAADRWVKSVLDVASGLLHPILRVVPRLSAALPPPPAPEPPADEVADWLRDMALVRPKVDALDGALVAGEVLASSAPAALLVAQQPVPSAGAGRWLATSAAQEGLRARYALVLAHDGSGASHGGLVMDSWSEVVPRAPGEKGPEEVVGVAFDFDRPGARAPQSLLVAVPPDLTRGWCLEDVHACVEETLLMARIRTLDLADLPELAPVLPIPQRVF